MLGGIVVDKRHYLIIVVQKNHTAVCKRLVHHLLSGQGCEKFFNHYRQFSSKCGIGGEQNRLAVGTVLGLRQEVACHKTCIGIAVGNNHHLRWTGRHINSRCTEAHLLLSLHHEAVARSEDFAHARHALSAESHGCDGLCATHLVDFGHARNACRVEYCRVHFPVFSRWSAQHNLAAASKACRNGKHQHRGKQRRVATGDIQTHPCDGYSLLSASYAGHCFHHNFFHALRLVESRNILCSHGNGILQLVRHCIDSFGYLIGRNFKAAELHAIEAGSHFAQSLVAT